MNLITKSLAIIGLAALCGIFIFADKNAPNIDTTKLNSPATDIKWDNDYNVYAIEMPTNLAFANEKVPLKISDVYERMDKELLVNTYWQSNGLLMIKRANRYFPVIEPILKKYGVPDDFKYLAVIESGLTNAVSPAGARGIWQIMKATATEKGLEVNENIDERYNLEKATELACLYFIDAKNRLGSWTLAAAAYNAGITGIKKQLTEQNVSNYYDLLLGEETGRYVFRVIALKEILNDPKKYGFNFNENDLYEPIPTTKIKVDSAIESLEQFAKSKGINYKILKIHNPWLREPFLKNELRKTYTIEIPKPGYY